MDKVIISVKNASAETIVKEAKKKAIDDNFSFTEVVLLLLKKWISGKISIDKKDLK